MSSAHDLDVRFFPLAIRDTQRYELDEQVQSAVEHMTNLEHLVWTVSDHSVPRLSC